MAINLSELEAGEPFDGDYDGTLVDLQKRLQRAQYAHIVHGRRVLLVFEGWDAAGKGGTIRRMVAGWDPRYFEVWPIGAPSPEAKSRHFLWRFWQKLPGPRSIAVFDRSWYGRVLVERVEGLAGEVEWRRAYDEINEFEAQQADLGTTIVKIFLHVTQETQDDRLRKRLDTPYKRWKVTAEDFRNRAKRDEYRAAMDDMFRFTDTRWAPWTAFDANNKKAVRIAVMRHVAERLEDGMPDHWPEPDVEIDRLAREAFGDLPQKGD